MQRRRVGRHHPNPGYHPSHRARHALRDDRVTHDEPAQRPKVAIAVRRDDRVSRLARKRAARHVPRTGPQRVIANAFDDDFVEAEPRNEEPRNGRSRCHCPARTSSHHRASARGGALRLELGPPRSRGITGDGGTRDRSPGPAEQHSSDDDQERAHSAANVGLRRGLAHSGHPRMRTRARTGSRRRSTNPITKSAAPPSANIGR